MKQTIQVSTIKGYNNFAIWQNNSTETYKIAPIQQDFQDTAHCQTHGDNFF